MRVGGETEGETKSLIKIPGWYFFTSQRSTLLKDFKKHRRTSSDLRCLN